MRDINHWRMDRPSHEGTIAAASEITEHCPLPIRMMAPENYEPGYAYPLVVFYHPAGGNEEHVMQVGRKMSRQNFIFLSLRGPEARGRRPDGKAGFGWHHAGGAPMLAEYLRLTVALARSTYHIHSERVYLAGIGEGAQAAFRTAFEMPDQIAGVVALNGGLPRVKAGQPTFRMKDVRGMRIFLARGDSHTSYTRTDAVQDYRALYAAGANVQQREYAVGNKLHGQMLRDVNQWIIGNVYAEAESYILR
ncbi:MAG: alpha/beta hydrolase [Gemmataceae bacterium]